PALMCLGPTRCDQPKGRSMKKDIHPDYHPVVFKDSATGKQFLTRSTATSDRTVEWEDGNEYPLIVVDITSESHPFWTGAQRVMDTAGRVEKFQRRYGGMARRKKKTQEGSRRVEENGSTKVQEVPRQHPRPPFPVEGG